MADAVADNYESVIGARPTETVVQELLDGGGGGAAYCDGEYSPAGLDRMLIAETPTDLAMLAIILLEFCPDKAALIVDALSIDNPALAEDLAALEPRSG